MSKFVRKQNLTIPFFSAQKEGESIFVKLMGEIVSSGYVPDNQTEEMKVIPAINLETGEQVNLIVSTVIKSNLEAFGDFKGHCFEILNRGKKGRGASSYTDFGIWEIEVEDDK